MKDKKIFKTSKFKKELYYCWDINIYNKKIILDTSTFLDVENIKFIELFKIIKEFKRIYFILKIIIVFKYPDNIIRKAGNMTDLLINNTSDYQTWLTKIIGDPRMEKYDLDYIFSIHIYVGNRKKIIKKKNLRVREDELQN